ncbi:MAG TPA: hypothetical protein VL225_09200 [Vicinamibacterales bacterium]|nr:hypothetical protein [Vicinamibacterales bacterium]
MLPLGLFVKIVTPVVIAYKLRVGTPFTPRVIATYILGIAGLLAFYAGFDLAAQEEARARYGRVVTGVIEERYSTTSREGTRHIGTYGGRNQTVTQPVVTIKGFHFYETFARLLVTGSPAAWVVDYRFPCDAGPSCYGRDFVTEELWSRLRAGQTVNVRRAVGETGTSRLDENPQWSIAFAQLGISAVLLLATGVVSGRLTVFGGPAWITAPAVVTAVDRVTYKDAVRWRVRFAYFDPDGVAQESADEVVNELWKPGDECLAVFRPNEPALATMRPVSLRQNGLPAT